MKKKNNWSSGIFRTRFSAEALSAAALTAVLFLAGCSSEKPVYSQAPSDFTAYRVSDPDENSLDNDADFIHLEPGRYVFANSETSHQDPAVIFNLYISDKQYENVSKQLRDELKAELSSGQSATLNLSEGQYLYVASDVLSGNADQSDSILTIRKD